jgi:hypothetical protein
MDILNHICKAIKEAKWLEITYENKQSETTSYWIAIKDIDPKTKRFKVDIRNSLHRILLETEELIHGSIESWERFSWSKEEMDDRKSALRYVIIGDSKGSERYELDADMFRDSYYGCERKDLFWDGFSARGYIFDEIEFATDLWLDDIKNLDDDFDEIDSSNGEAYEKYGYHGVLDVNPTMVFEHVLTKYLSSVYKIVFEDLF